MDKNRIRQALDKKKYGLHFDNIPKVIKSDLKRTPRTPKVERKLSNVDFTTSEETVLFTGGIGDVLALESFFSDTKRSNLKKIYYATRAADPIIEIFKVVYPNCIHTKIWTDFSRFFCFYSKGGVTQELVKANKPVPDDWRLVQDWSIGPRFNAPKVYNKSSAITTKLTNITPAVPDYYVIVPFSPNDQRDPSRRFTNEEWVKVIAHLKAKGMKGVIINSGNFEFSDPQIINLSGKTSILESIEYVKKSKGYIGVDSSLSVLATKILLPDSIKIKSNNGHLMNYKHVYYDRTLGNFYCEKLVYFYALGYMTTIYILFEGE